MILCCFNLEKSSCPKFPDFPEFPEIEVWPSAVIGIGCFFGILSLVAIIYGIIWRKSIFPGRFGFGKLRNGANQIMDAFNGLMIIFRNLRNGARDRWNERVRDGVRIEIPDLRIPNLANVAGAAAAAPIILACLAIMIPGVDGCHNRHEILDDEDEIRIIIQESFIMTLLKCKFIISLIA